MNVTAALSLANHLIELKPAAVLGKRGGEKPAERGPEYFTFVMMARRPPMGSIPNGEDEKSLCFWKE